MVDVFVKTTLTNAFDRARARRGSLKPEYVRRVEVEARVDTGAVRCVIPRHILDELGVDLADQQVVTLADGRSHLVHLSDVIVFNLLDRETAEEAIVMGDEVLIGQTVLEKLDLWVHCRELKVVGNPDHPHEARTRL